MVHAKDRFEHGAEQPQLALFAGQFEGVREQKLYDSRCRFRYSWCSGGLKPMS